MKFQAGAFVAMMVLLSVVQGQAESSWVEVRSPHFNVLTDGSERQGREVALRFEHVRSVFNQLFRTDPSKPSGPLQVIALKSDRETSLYAPLYQGRPVSVAGFYLQNQDKGYILLDLGANNLWETIFHEYSHCLLDTIAPNLPLWFSEGFAGFYSTIQVASKQAIIGRPPGRVMTILRDEKLLPVSALLNIDRSSPVYNDDRHPRSIFYAQSWLLVRYLLENQKMEQARKYFNLVGRHVAAGEAFSEAFEIAPQQMDARLERYVRAGSDPMRVRLPEELEKITLSSQAVPQLNASAVLADLHSHQPDYRRLGIHEFEEILRLDPENTMAHRGLGYALFQEHDPDGAIPHLEKAAKMGPGDWLTHYYWAELMAQKQDEGLAPQMEREARLVTQLNPEMADGHALLGFALMTQHRAAEATAAYEIARRLDPASEIYALNLAELYTRLGQEAPARELFLGLQYSDNTTVATAARSHLELMAIEKKKTEMN
ncbi:MAG TPA: tetratricopeptide repeat protein [Candidatus Saccharimonadales bacterium]|jgi:tetratricopeptide (TPR) repeat protein|nr:tetratricopeptide repeat protein [Candidatus Saccharimonadales bacterium]